jgi:site-specific DNA recombinase
MTKRAVLYARVSTMLQSTEGVSLDTQLDMAKRHCEREGWQFAGLYQDAGISGTRDNRPELARLESDAALKKFEVALVYKTDRLARSLLKLLQVAATLHDHGVALVSLTEPIDFASDMGAAMLGMLGAFAQMESRNISTRVRDSLRLVAARGGNTGSVSSALGYRYNSEANRLEIVPDEAETARAIFETYIALRSYRATAGAMNEAGRRTREGKTFSVQAVRWILGNPIYMGTLVWGRTESKKRSSTGARRIVMLPAEKWIQRPEAHEAIIDAETWRQVQAIAAENADNHPRLIHSRARFAWSQRRDGTVKRITGYECRSRKSRGHQSCPSPAYLADVFLDAHAVPAIAAALQGDMGARPAKTPKPARQKAGVAAQVAALQAQADRAWEMYVVGRWTNERALAVEAEMKGKIAELTSIAGPSPVAVAPPRVKDFMGAWTLASEAVRGDMLRLYVDHVEANKTEMVVIWREGMGLEPLTIPRVSMTGTWAASVKGKPRAW